MKNKIILILFLFLSSAASATVYDWVGGASPNPNAWTDKNNWKVPGCFGLCFVTPSTAPGSTDDIQLGVNFTFTNANAPIITANASCASVSFGTSQASSVLTVAGSSVTLTITGTIEQLPSAVSINILGSNTVTGTLAGTGSISCASVQAGDLITLLNVLALTTNNVQLVSTVANLNVTGNINVYSTAYIALVIPLGYNNAAFYLRGGTATVNGQLLTKNLTNGILPVGSAASVSTFTIDIPSSSALTPNLKLTNATPIDPASIAGSIDFYNNGGGSGTCTVEYSGTSPQTVYTESSTLLNISPAVYQNIIFSSAGVKNVTSGNLSVWGNWNSASGKVDVISNNPSVIFGGAAQSLSDAGSDGGNGVVFKNVFVQGSNTKTMSASGSGKFAVSSAGILTMSGTATLAAGGVLTLNSDAAGSATVASIPSGTAITGNVNVQRYINGGSLSYRGYRLLTSPVNNGSGNFTLEYLKLAAYVTGTTMASGGFDASPNANNPTIYFFRENTAYSNTAFTTGNFRGVNSLGSSPYSFDNESGTFSLPSGNGFLFFYRGSRASTIAQATVASHVPENTTFTATGTLNQGNITVKHWYTGTNSLIYTTTTGSKVQGYNLVANPYASTINFEKFNRKGTSGAVADATSSIYISGQKAQIYTTTTANIPPLVFIWVFNPITKQYETYQPNANQITSVADTTTTINPGIQSVSGGAASNMIASGQGFFIRATASGQTMTFRESAKTTTQPNTASLTKVFSIPHNNMLIALSSMQNKFTAMDAASNLGTPYVWPAPLLRLQLVKDSINSDGIAIVLMKGASSKYDAGKDAEDLGGNGAPESLSVLSSDSVKITIHRHPLPGKTQETIRLFTDATASGPYKLKLTDLKELPNLYEVWLKDNFSKDSVNIKANPEYNFTIDKGNNASFGVGRLQLVVRQNQTLMVHLLSFDAKKATDGAQISWLTENEANYTTFIIERSTDNGKTFDPIGTLYSSGAKNYSFNDPTPVQGLNQYRLKQIDLNGDATYSKIAPVMFTNKAQNTLSSIINLYPNPATDVIHAEMKIGNSNSFKYKINITNSEGKVMATATSSQSNWQNDVAAFVPGTYIMQIVNAKDNTVIGFKKFIKQ